MLLPLWEANGMQAKNTIEVVIRRKLIKKDDKYGGVDPILLDDKGLNNNNCYNEDTRDGRKEGGP